MKKNLFFTNKSSIKKIATAVVLLSATASLKAQAPGGWNTSPATTTPNAVGIGTVAPIGWEEIRYCDEMQKGLVITNTVCTNPKNFPITFDGKVETLVLSTDPPPPTYNYPVANFTLQPFNNFSNNNPLIWARMENHATLLTAASGSYSSRFIVTPGGTSGINIEVPRATFDVKSLGLHNYPGLIVGRQAMGVTGRTRHVMFVPLLGNDAYNKITQTDDQGMFFTDGKGINGANIDGTFVIAPWANNGDPLVGGLRLDKWGNLEVHGKTKTTELNVNVKWWSDFVFANDYRLMNLSELEKFIAQNHHLPNVPAECEMLENGLDVAEMQAIHMQKIEELTLYAIAQDKEIKQLKENATQQQAEIEDLKKKVNLLLDKTNK